MYVIIGKMSSNNQRGGGDVVGPARKHVRFAASTPTAHMHLHRRIPSSEGRSKPVIVNHDQTPLWIGGSCTSIYQISDCTLADEAKLRVTLENRQAILNELGTDDPTRLCAHSRTLKNEQSSQLFVMCFNK